MHLNIITAIALSLITVSTEDLKLKSIPWLEMLEFEENCKRYPAQIVKVTDGDTASFDIDLGFDVKLVNQKLRMYGYNAPESRTKNTKEKKLGMRAKQKLNDLIQSSFSLEICIEPNKEKEKYGRLLGIIFADNVNINTLLINQGYGIAYFGGKRSTTDFDSMYDKVYNELKGEDVR